MDVFLMNKRDIENEVIQYLMERYPIRKHWFKSGIRQVTKDWTLQDDYQFLPEDAHDFLLDIFGHFNIEHSNFDGRNYFEYEYPIWQKKPLSKALKPLTVGMIIESAKAGKWLYD
ncbi:MULTISPECIES: DUF1493 family protein [Pectobacterium]|uniref:DUF1493 family protein n=1 Tax=Pectobacterium TaxID=122277 RepID=UPI00027E0B29|nr:hypothetical protein PCC21_007410 [Pectobacterium carotovorum subsp. carotovorum PCC21]KFF68146.1 hypothetical protein IV99_02400 [Pectobacterium brasiliense]KHT17099.1 hypothetical protein RC97_14310 [Pectobacterium brasiliense]MBN3066870.1 DUF1493 family protein [Pectobacterium brasiliense]MBN3144233.1 DUF1493 family protein [Pectobacterium brasiliense]